MSSYDSNQLPAHGGLAVAPYGHAAAQASAPALAPVVLQVPGAWGIRALLEIALAVALVFAVATSGPPRAWGVIAALVVLPMLVFTRKMLILDPAQRMARGASVSRWFTNVQHSFDVLRPWVSVQHEVHNVRDRNTGSVRTSRFNRRHLHLTPQGPPFAHTTSEFGGFERFAIVVNGLVGAHVDPSLLAQALAAERVRVLARAVVTSLLAFVLLAFAVLASYERGAIGMVMAVPALGFALLSLARWLVVSDAAVIRARGPVPAVRLRALAVHGGVGALWILAVPLAVILHGADEDASRERWAAQRDEGGALSAKDLAEHPAKGAVAPRVTVPTQSNAIVNASSVESRLSGKGFRVKDKGSDASPQYAWRLEATTGGPSRGTLDVSLRVERSSKITSKLIGSTWVSVYTQAGDVDIVASDKSRAAVLAFIGSRDTSDATLKAALVSVGGANVTARSGKAWGWTGPKRHELTVDAIPLQETNATMARSCTRSTGGEGLLCAELNRTIYKKTDPGFASYAAAVASGS